MITSQVFEFTLQQVPASYSSSINYSTLGQQFIIASEMVYFLRLSSYLVQEISLLTNAYDISGLQVFNNMANYLQSLQSALDIPPQVVWPFPDNLSGIVNLSSGVESLADWQQAAQFFPQSSIYYDLAQRYYQAVQYVGSNPPFTNVVAFLALNWGYFVPFNQLAQQDLIYRNVILNLAARFLMIAALQNSPNTGQVEIVTPLVNQNVMDVSAAVYGNFENWQNLINVDPVLQPTQIFNGGTSINLEGSSSNLQSIYGSDFFINAQQSSIGLNAPQTWGGDFAVISGVNNVLYALGRRLMTPLGYLIYEPQYGSRVPSEIGSPLSQATLGIVQAFVKSTLLSDPRVKQVQNIQIATNNNQIAVSAKISLQNNVNTQFLAIISPQGVTLQQ